MKYYKVKLEHDQKVKGDCDIYIGDELYSEDEVIEYNLDVELMEAIEKDENDVYWFFGARFSV